MTALVCELLLKRPDFARLWERHEVTSRKPAQTTSHHPHTHLPVHAAGARPQPCPTGRFRTHHPDRCSHERSVSRSKTGNGSMKRR
ncbi:hypothetical protein ACFV2S_20175 [Streptomyces sp. NPDC059695]|uniref:MmyB family transcriptional regulator n=1 Tax=Streptomyces sp. NPDC059695 TaxID=3346910 RepID=UPI00368583EE